MNDNVREFPGGVYKIEIIISTGKQLAGYCWIIKDGTKYYQYYVTRDQYLPPITGVLSTVFNYNTPDLPSSFESLSKFLTLASDAIHEDYPGATIGHVALMETHTAWELP